METETLQKTNVKQKGGCYWLKLNKEFFNQPVIKKLRRIAGGDTYCCIYLKLQLLSVPTDGILYFDGIEEDMAMELSLKIDEDVENIRVTLNFLEQFQMIEQIAEDEYKLPEAANSIGRLSDAGIRQRRSRGKTLPFEYPVRILKEIPEERGRTEEIEKEKEIEKEERDRSVTLSQNDRDNREIDSSFSTLIKEVLPDLTINPVIENSISNILNELGAAAGEDFVKELARKSDGKPGIFVNKLKAGTSGEDFQQWKFENTCGECGKFDGDGVCPNKCSCGLHKNKDGVCIYCESEKRRASMTPEEREREAAEIHEKVRAYTSKHISKCDTCPYHNSEKCKTCGDRPF